MRFLKYSFFFALGILLQSPLHAQEWVSYQSQQQINDLVETGNELLMATDAGLVVMNKSTLEKTIFNKANSDLSNNHIQSITEAPNGNSWIGTYDGILAIFDGSDFTDVVIPESPEYNPEQTELYDFEIAPNGDFWLGTSDGIFHRQGQNWLHYDADELGDLFFKAWDIEIDENGVVFIGSNTVHKYVDGLWTDISSNTELFAYIGADLFFASSGDLYFAGDLERVGRFDGNQWQEYEFSFQLNGSQVIKFTEDVDGNVYFNTRQDGIFKIEGNELVQQMDAQTEQFENWTSYFHIDEQNNRWLNNNIHLTVNENGNIQSTLISQHTIEINNINEIHKGENGDLFFITGYYDNISVVSPDGNWSFLPYPDPNFTSEYFTDILYLSDDNIWLAALNGLYHYDGNDWTFTGNIESCTGFAVDSQGKIYVRTPSRILIIENNVITADYNTNNSPLTGIFIAGLGVDANDNLWIAEGGINSIQKVSSDGTWTAYTDAEYPSIDLPLGDFHFDSNGNVWVPADLVGVLKYDGTTWTNPVKDNIDLLDNYNVYSIESDSTGKVYFAHQYGVTTLLDDEWGSLVIEDVPNVNSSHKASIKFDDDGTLWWASQRYGVFSYTPEMVTSTLLISEAKTNFSIYPNPATSYSNIEFTLSEKSSVDLFVYNTFGQLQSTVNLGSLPVGTFQQTIDLTSFSKGLYTVQLKVNDKSSSHKIVIK